MATEDQAKKMGVGIAIGVGVGTAIGVAIDNLGVGIGVGIALGVVFGASWSREEASPKDDVDQSDEETGQDDGA